MTHVKRIVVLGAILAILPSPAFAYIDPAVGSMLFQGVIGAIAIAGTAWYTLRQKVSDFFRSLKSKTSSGGSEAK